MTSRTTPRLAFMVWLLLVVATLASAWLAEHHAIAGQLTAAAVMIVAWLKGRAIVLYFMELRNAPLAWRLAFELWCLLATGVIVGLWALAGTGH